MIQTSEAIYFYLILLVSCKDFDQDACANNCSYLPHQVTKFTCQGKNDSWVVPDISTHLVLDGCHNLNMLDIQSLKNVVSVTIQNSKIYRNPSGLFKTFSHIKCLRFEAVEFTRNSCFDEYFEPLINLEFIELNFTQLSHKDMQNLLRGFTKKHKLNSFTMTQQALRGRDILLGDILMALNQTKLTCLTIQHEKDRNLSVPLLTKEAPNLEILNFLKCMRFDRNEWGIQNILGHKHLKVVQITYYDNVLIWPNTYLAQSQRSKRSLNYIDGFFKNLTKKYIKEMNFPFIDRCNGDRILFSGDMLPPVEKVLFQHSSIRIINNKATTCLFAQDSNIEYIDFSYSLILKDLYGLNFVLYGFDNLRIFNAEGNLITTIPDIFFNFLPSLETLLLGGNRLGNVIKMDLNGSLFSQLSSLRLLDLSDNYIQIIHYKTFSGLHQLTVLNLSRNIISSLEIDFIYLKSLEMLDLHSNRIFTLPSETRYSLKKAMSAKSDIKINMAENEVRCSCEDIQFIKWFQETGDLVFNDYSTFNCSNTHGEIESLALLNLVSLRTFCNPLTAEEKAGIFVPLIIFAFIVFVIIVATGFVIYKKRLQKHYWMYFNGNEIEDDIEYLYDAYVCYSSDDSEFVHNILRPTLEDTYNLKLCLDQRDFLAGNFITDNILESIEQSRKTLLVLSPSFLQSEWCRYEMKMAHDKHLQGGKDIIVPLLYKNCDLNADITLKCLVKKITYIKWNGGNGKFWDHLSLILKAKQT